MKTLEQSRSEAIKYLESRIKFWEHLAKTGEKGHFDRLSKKDIKFLDTPGGTAEQGLKALAERKLKALNRELNNLKRKLGRD